MLEDLLKDRAAIDRMRAGELGAHVDGIARSLVEAGYARQTARCHLWTIADFGRWLGREGVALSEVDDQAVAAYLIDWRRKGGTSRRGVGVVVRRVVDHLRAEGVALPHEVVGPATPVCRILNRFGAYLLTERGVKEVTVSTYRPFVRCFLDEQVAAGKRLLLRTLSPTAVSTNLLRQARALSAGRAKVMVTALRAFFRFLLCSGEIDIDLSACVLSVANRTSSTVPRYLEQQDVERLLDACDQRSRVGRRNYALLLLLARLGLRASEVMTLELEDIDWRAGEITVAGKGRTRERLPLPRDVGAALAAYLRNDRPTCSTRRVFTRVRAPWRGLGSPSTVSTIVMRALERADLRPPVRGTHLLRHSLATGMLRRGASLSEIGQILRHRTCGATEVYAKVDIAGLRSVAQPWPRRGEAK